MHIAGIELPALRGNDVAKSIAMGMAAGLVVAAIAWPVMHHFRAGSNATRPIAAQPAPLPQQPLVAEFGSAQPSPDALYIANWVADARDNGGRPFVIVDKRFAHVYVFDAQARLVGDTPVLLGAASGDDSVAGIGQKAIEDIPEHERTTPAGRFMAQRGVNARNEDVVWIDYGAAVSMHRVLSTVAAERRLERLASPTVEDNRISWGCINIPVAFFEAKLAPNFRDFRAPVYVLPEVKRLDEVFPAAYDVKSRRQSLSSGIT